MEAKPIEINGKPYCQITIDATHQITITKKEALTLFQKIFNTFNTECVKLFNKRQCNDCESCEDHEKVSYAEQTHDARNDLD